MTERMPRSYLFVPGNRPERFDKAMAAGADAVILDLEDAVPLADKAAAREAVQTWLAARERSGPVQIVVRINAGDSAEHAADVAACAAVTPHAVMCPKAHDAGGMATIAQRLGPQVALLPLIESAAGFEQAAAIAQVPQVQRLVFGSIDFQLDLGIEGEGEELLYFRSQLVLVSRLANLAAPVDGVSTALDDAPALLADARRARRLGFGAKLCIHPKQVAPVHQAFAPDAQQIEWARRVVAAAEAAGGAAVQLDGRMVDRPVILKAQEVLARADNPAPAKQNQEPDR